MQVTTALKAQVIQAIVDDMKRKSATAGAMTNQRHANQLKISASVYSRLLKGETEKVLSEGEWVRLGMILGVDIRGIGWRTAATETYLTITAQLELCKEQALSAVFCDEKGIGKTHAAKEFARNHANVAYVDCSQCKSKRELIRAVAGAFGFDTKGRLVDVRQNMVDNIYTLSMPLLILDEVGDLSYEAFLEIKCLWNALEGMCGFYLMGANGLQKKIETNISNRTVGYEEIFDRLGDRYQSVTKKLSETEIAQFKRRQAEAVLAANVPGLKNTAAAREMIAASGLNLRRLYIEIVKSKTVAA